MSEDAATQLYRAFVTLDPAGAIAVIEEAKLDGVAQASLLDRVFAPAMSLLGGAWASGVIDEYAFTEASVVAEQVGSFIIPPAPVRGVGVTILAGTIHRDTHSIGKAIVAAALREAGYSVVDLGVDVRPSDFLERAEETGSRLLFIFAEQVATARSVARVRELFATQGRDDVVIFVSGGPFAADQDLARSVGANGVARGAESALKLVAKIAARAGGVA
jgi:methylmalonyl-CoA mutase cobalamin-binding domain/chain